MPIFRLIAAKCAPSLLPIKQQQQSTRNNRAPVCCFSSFSSHYLPTNFQKYYQIEPRQTVSANLKKPPKADSQSVSQNIPEREMSGWRKSARVYFWKDELIPRWKLIRVAQPTGGGAFYLNVSDSKPTNQKHEGGILARKYGL